MRVLVAGGSGFIGRNLLLQAPDSWEIVATYLKSRDFELFVKRHELTNVQPLRVDLSSLEDTKMAFGKNDSGFDLLLHLAANTDVPLSVKRPKFDWQSNVEALLNLITVSKTKDLLYLSSGAVYDGSRGLVGPKSRTAPAFPYAISKLAAEHYVEYARKNGLVKNYTILRFFGAYGPYEPPRKIYTRLVKCFGIQKRRSFEIWGDGRNLIDAMYVTDAIRGIMAVVNSHHRDLTIDFTSGQPRSIRQLVHEVARIFGIDRARVISVGKPPEYNEFYASPRDMQKLYSFKPRIPLRQGILELRDWLVNGP